MPCCPTLNLGFRDLSCGNPDEKFETLGRIERDRVAVRFKKHFHQTERGPLIAVEERMYNDHVVQQEGSFLDDGLSSWKPFADVLDCVQQV